jgi:translation initiation factor IF-1
MSVSSREKEINTNRNKHRKKGRISGKKKKDRIRERNKIP